MTDNLDKIITDLELAIDRQTYWRMDFFVPYEKQKRFFALGSAKRERMLFGANQGGKTEAGAFEVACHLTGRYPKWWEGRRFDKPVRCWAAGETSLAVRDTAQKKLCGEPGVKDDLGKGMIPKGLFVDTPTLSRGVTDAYDTVHVAHASGGTSVLKFKSYEQGRGKFQGETLDFIWTDEECPMDIYTECLARITATGGMILGTFTPLKGRTALVERFQGERSSDRDFVTMTLYECGHMTPEMIADVVRGYPAHEREARINGVPMLGSGRVFPYADEMIWEEPLPVDRVPGFWRKLWAIDFGIGHPFAAVMLLHDADNDVIHVHQAFRIQAKPGEAGGLPINHAARMKATGAMVPVAWPHDGNQRDKGSGVALAAAYRKEGLFMLPTHAAFREGGYSTEAGVVDLDARMQNGKFKVGKHLTDWFEEYRNYHRKDGLIVKERDDLMSATRIGVMQIRSARVVPLGSRIVNRGPNEKMAQGLDFDLF